MSKEIFDRELLVERMMGDEELAGEILELFLESAPEQIHGLKEAIEARDMTQARERAHTLKGAAANISAGALQNAAYLAEQAGENDEPEKCAEHLREIEHQYDILKSVLVNS